MIPLLVNHRALNYEEKYEYMALIVRERIFEDPFYQLGCKKKNSQRK